MNIFANLKDYSKLRRKREIVLLFNESFCDYQLIKETINQFDYNKEDITYILQTTLLTDNQEVALNSFLSKELGVNYKNTIYKPSKHYIDNGQPSVAVYHRNLEVYVFTSDPTEADIKELNNKAKNIAGWASTIRRQTSDEVINKYKKDLISNLKGIISTIANILLTIMIIGGIILGCIFIHENKEAQSILAIVVIMGIILLIFTVVWALFTNEGDSMWKQIVKAIGITFVVIAILILIGAVIPDSCTSFYNDAHRPDRF